MRGRQNGSRPLRFFCNLRPQIWRIVVAMNAASSCLALQPSGPLRPLSPNKKFDTAPKEVYKKCVDICLNDFCYPRAKRAFDELPPSKIETNAVVRSHDGERIFAMERVRL
jgi:hypothetical protein